MPEWSSISAVIGIVSIVHVFGGLVWWAFAHLRRTAGEL